MSKFSQFLQLHLPIIQQIAQVSEAVVTSGATGTGTDQARHNFFLASAILHLFEIIAEGHGDTVAEATPAEPEPAPVPKFDAFTGLPLSA